MPKISIEDLSQRLESLHNEVLKLLEDIDFEFDGTQLEKLIVGQVYGMMLACSAILYSAGLHITTEK